MRVRVVLVFVMMGILGVPVPASGATSDAADAEECSLVVCAESEATISSSCRQGIDPYTGVGFVACTIRFLGTAAGSSPVFLPGDVSGSGKAQLDWSCTPGYCNAERIRESLDYDTYWNGGPDVPEAGMASGASRGVEVAKVTIRITASAGTVGPCLAYEATLANEAIARVPRLDPAVPDARLDEAVALDDASLTGGACFE